MGVHRLSTHRGAFQAESEWQRVFKSVERFNDTGVRIRMENESISKLQGILHGFMFKFESDSAPDRLWCHPKFSKIQYSNSSSPGISFDQPSANNEVSKD